MNKVANKTGRHRAYYDKCKVREGSLVWWSKVQLMEAGFKGNAELQRCRGEGRLAAYPCLRRKKGRTKPCISHLTFQKCMVLKVDTYPPDGSSAFHGRD